MEIIVSILIYIGAIAGGSHANDKANNNGVRSRVEAQNPHLVEFINLCQHGTTHINSNHKTYMMVHQHNSTNDACYIHIYGYGKNFEKSVINKGCIFKLIGIDDLID